MIIKSTFRGLILASVLPLFVGCVAPEFKVNVATPAPSEMKYANVDSANKTQIVFSDKRNAEEPFSSGRLTYHIQQDGQNIEELKFIAKAAVAELNARGIPTALVEDASADNTVNVLSLKLFNHRHNAYSPLVTLTSLSADIESSKGSNRIAAYVKRGKVPIWTLTEKGIVENAFNQPLEVLAKELASHINKTLYGYAADDAYVDALIKKIDNRPEQSPLAYMDVYQLGFSNNLKAVNALVKYSSDKDEYIRLAAISSLGILQAEEQIPLLKEIYTSSKLWQDRGMALKAIGNMGTEATQAFLQEELKKYEGKEDKESTWNVQIIKLFL